MANVIKKTIAEDVAAPRRTFIKNRVVEAEEEARQIVSDAKTRAEHLVAEAEAEAEGIRANSYEAGRSESLSEFTEIITAALEKRETTLRDLEREVLRLSVKIAEKIIGHEIKTDKKTVVDMVAVAMRNVRQQDRLIIRVNPTDLPAIEEQKALLNQSGRASFVDFEPDPKIASGGCIIESEVGTVDARLETQMRILERALLRQTEADDKSQEV